MLASTQGYQSMDTPDGGHRPLVRETTLEEYRRDPGFAKEQGDFSHHYFPSLDDEAETFLLMREPFDRVKKAERRLR